METNAHKMELPPGVPPQVLCPQFPQCEWQEVASLLAQSPLEEKTPSVGKAQLGEIGISEGMCRILLLLHSLHGFLLIENMLFQIRQGFSRRGQTFVRWHTLPFRQSEGLVPVIVLEVHLGIDTCLDSLKPVVKDHMVLCRDGSGLETQYKWCSFTVGDALSHMNACRSTGFPTMQFLPIRECVVECINLASPHVGVQKLGLPVLSATEHFEWTQAVVFPRHLVQDKHRV